MPTIGRRHVAALLAAGLGIAIVGGLLFPELSMAGYRFMVGNTPSEINVSEPAMTQDGSAHWVQEDYSDEIQSLSRIERYVTQRNGTEPPFKNELYDNERPGIYVDVVSGEPLFASIHKFDSGTGWPSFYRPLEPENIIRRRDPGPLGDRIEVQSRYAGSHLGHVFRHGGTPTGLRYCINSAALEFIPAGELEERGYGRYSDLFAQ